MLIDFEDREPGRRLGLGYRLFIGIGLAIGAYGLITGIAGVLRDVTG